MYVATENIFSFSDTFFENCFPTTAYQRSYSAWANLG